MAKVLMKVTFPREPATARHALVLREQANQFMLHYQDLDYVALNLGREANSYYQGTYFYFNEAEGQPRENAYNSALKEFERRVNARMQHLDAMLAGLRNKIDGNSAA